MSWRGWGDGSLGFSAQTHAPATWTQISSRKWIDGSYIDRSIIYLNILIGLRVYVTIRRSLWFFQKSHHAWNYLLSSVLRTIHTAAASWAKDRHGDPSHGPTEEIPQVRFVCVCVNNVADLISHEGSESQNGLRFRPVDLWLSALPALCLIDSHMS